MPPRLPLRFSFTRSYATRLPERPPYRAPDPLRNNPHAVEHELPGNLTLIHRPPPTAPSPHSYTTAPASPLLRDAAAVQSASALPPTLRRDKPPPPRVSDEDLARLRRLRREDPATWTRGRLAKEFNCTPWFVGQVTSLKAADRRRALEVREREHETARSRWGERRALVNDIRKKRKEFW